MLQVIPLSLRAANDFVAQFHRHSGRTQRDGGKFAIGATDGDTLCGVAIVGRPVARSLQDNFTAEITRCCVHATAPRNACSFLYGRCWRIWQQMGGRRMITYTLASESGASLRAAGWRVMGEVGARRAWDGKCGTREWQPIYGQLKFRWHIKAA